jgi:hypothetical protein
LEGSPGALYQFASFRYGALVFGDGGLGSGRHCVSGDLAIG